MEKAYGYVRLSKDEYGEKRDSLENQKDIITRYTKDNNIELVKILEDNDISGYKFSQRDGLTALKELIVDGECKIVITKDLSRLGRDNAHILLLLNFFEENGIRYILPNENFDSIKDDRGILGIKAWYNDYYGRDISNKMKGTLNEVQKSRGLIILPPYGYKKIYDNNGKWHIDIDEEAANVVKEIFRMYLDGYGFKGIAIHLNKKKYPSPNTRKQTLYNKDFQSSSGLWYHSAIMKIIKDESYTGTLVNRKTVVRKISTSLKNVVDDENRIKHEDYYEPIISKSDYATAQKLLIEKRTNNVRANSCGIPNLFTGFLICGDCKSGMVFRKKEYKASGEIRQSEKYRCGRYHKLGRDFCTPHNITQDFLKDIVVDEIKRLYQMAIDNSDKIDKEIEKLKKKNYDYFKTLDSLKLKQTQVEIKIQNYIDEKNAGRIPETMANKFIENVTNEYSILEEQIKEVENLKNDSEINGKQILKSVNILKAIVDKKDVDRKDIELLIKEVIVYDNQKEKKIEIEWKKPFSFYNVQLPW